MSNSDSEIALAGIPNCGKTALFNALTGGKQKVGNYPGVTVERKEGALRLPSGRVVQILDLPGTYSLDATTPDEAITRDVLLGAYEYEKPPELLVAVADATNLERNLAFVLELRELKRNMILALNMMDLAQNRGIEIDLRKLEQELGIPVVPTIAVQKQGVQWLLEKIEKQLPIAPQASTQAPVCRTQPTAEEVHARFQEVDRILKSVIQKKGKASVWTARIDQVVMHPLYGSVLLGLVLLILFQAIFTWAKVPMDALQSGIDWFSGVLMHAMPEGLLRNLLVDGIISGVGSVVVFLPQILLLFFFILLLEDSGYMARAAFLMDKLMSKVGLHGRAFIPLLSSHACAIPGIMATRTIAHPRDRLATILVAPLTTCSARLPVYSLLVGAFIPNRHIAGPLTLQGVVMFGLYGAGIFSSLGMAMLFRKTVLKGPRPPLLIELPDYKMPSLRNVVFGLLERARLFLRRAGTIILGLSILIWFLSSYPKPPQASLTGTEPSKPAIEYSYAGKLGRMLAPLVRPIGFDWKISVALIPGFAAREVMVGALATVYAVETTDAGGGAQGDTGKQAVRHALGQKLSQQWSLATALALIVWYIFSPQCISTLAIIRRETNSWRWPAFLLTYMTTLAYSAAFVVFHLATYFQNFKK